MLKFKSGSATALLVATLLFAISLTPSMLPRHFAVQGLLSGVSLAAGYALGNLAQWVWRFLELPEPGEGLSRWIKWIALLVFGGTAIVFLAQTSAWQNTIRGLMSLPEVHGARPFMVGAIALVVFAVLLVIGRVFAAIYDAVSRRLRRYIPRKIAGFLGVVAAAVLFATIIDGLIFRQGLRIADSAFQVTDELIEPELAVPSDPAMTGSSASLLQWDDLSRTGRNFIAHGPGRDDLEAFFGAPADQPIRVYVGLRSAATVEARAQLALSELIRAGGFDRSTLLLVVPTGTGWIDPGGLDTVEFLHRGDIASVAMQYSYLPSMISIFVEPNYSANSARVLFRTIYDHWKTLPPDRRPRFYLHGLSLGALGSQQSAGFLDIIDDPIHGALWVGPPFPSQRWRDLTRRREPGSPAWLPVIDDGSIIRFTNQTNAIATAEAPWRAIRIGYLQYASDPLVFFEPESFYREPAWLKPPRAPDITPDLTWYPVVTFLQIASDIITSSAHIGYGHAYAPEHYIDAWLEVTNPPDWTDAEIERLKARFIEGRPSGYFERRAQQTSSD